MINIEHRPPRTEQRKLDKSEIFYILNLRWSLGKTVEDIASYMRGKVSKTTIQMICTGARYKEYFNEYWRERETNP